MFHVDGENFELVAVAAQTGQGTWISHAERPTATFWKVFAPALIPVLDWRSGNAIGRTECDGHRAFHGE